MSLLSTKKGHVASVARQGYVQMSKEYICTAVVKLLLQSFKNRNEPYDPGIFILLSEEQNGGLDPRTNII